MPKVVLNIFVLVITIILGYLAGSFSKGFEVNLCYSSILSHIQNDINNAVESKNKNDLSKIKRKLELLPINGYESNCEDISRMYPSDKGILQQ